jgi:hypothetical protein
VSPRDWNVLHTFSLAVTSTPTVVPVSVVLAACAPPETQQLAEIILYYPSQRSTAGQHACMHAIDRPTCYLCDGEAEADGGVGERHDGGDDGQPPELVEVGELRQQDLDAGEDDDHVHRVVGLARRVVPVAVEAVGPVDRSETINSIQTTTPNELDTN